MTDSATAEKAEIVETPDDVFEGDDTEGKSEETTEEPKSEDTKGEPEEKVKEETKTEEPATPAEEEPKTVPIAALLDERRKAQLYKEENTRLKDKYESETEAPDPAEDPKGYEEWMETKVTNKLFVDRAEKSRSRMLEKHEDYEEMERVFAFLRSQDDTLETEMRQHPDPGQFAYDKAKEYVKTQEERLSPGLKEKLKAEILEELKTEKKSSEDEARNASAVKVPDLTKATAAGSNTVEKVEMSDDDDLFKDSPF